MAVWRKKAYQLFGFRRGAYSYGHGVVDLVADLREMARRAASQGEDPTLDRIFSYVLWLNTQRVGRFHCALDIEFFMPAICDTQLRPEAFKRLPPELYVEKAILVAQADALNHVLPEPKTRWTGKQW